MKLKITKTKIIIIVVLGIVLAAAILLWPRTPSNQPQKQAMPQAQEASAPPLSYAEQVFKAMSLHDKVASLFIFHISGTDPTAAANFMTSYKPSGLIFMGDNIPDGLNSLRAQTAALIVDKKLPPLLAVDEEGGTVKRLAADTYPGAQMLSRRPPPATNEAFSQRSDLLKSVGLNLNFGIVADVTANPKSFIYPRVLGTTPQAASDRVVQAVTGSKNKTLSTLKHFPGHGETSADSHTGIPTAPTGYDDWLNRVSVPFKVGIDAGADAVMFGHLRYPAIDSQPASLSSKWHDTIRNEMGFKGLIVTDDMIMLQDSGEVAYADPAANAVAALAAGNDLLLYVLDHGSQKSRIDPNTLIDAVTAAVGDGRIAQTKLDEHVKRVLAVRYALGQVLYP